MWENTVYKWNTNDSDRLWIANFRLLKATFEFVCGLLNVRLLEKDTVLRKSISVHKRVVICLWDLSTGEDFRSFSWRFDVGKSTACTIVNDVCQSIVDILLPLYIRWPSRERLLDILDGFSSK